jgi:hypothetical protein
VSAVLPAEQESSDGQRRAVVVHYHFYKNAGSSVDAALQHAFGDGWETWEGEGDGPVITAGQLADHLRSRWWVLALSSHRANLPAPELPGVQVIPIVLLRHPIDRVRSVYAFARRNPVDAPGTRNARRMTFREFVAWRLSRPRDRTIRNFQTVRLAPAGEGPTELARALDATGRLPYIGLVEAYQQSLARLETLLGQWFPDLDLPVTWTNRSDDRERSLEARLEGVTRDLGPDLFDQLERANQDDIAVWSTVRRQYPDA